MKKIVRMIIMVGTHEQPEITPQSTDNTRGLLKCERNSFNADAYARANSLGP
jgi:hypothetical protein